MSAVTVEAAAAQCPRCDAYGTHWLICPTLRLPDDYRFELDQEASS